MLETLSFSLPEVLALLGLAQCVYILVHMALRAGRGSHTGLPSAYFGALGVAFFLNIAGPFLAPDSPAYADATLAAWLALPPLAALLVVQIASIPQSLALRDLWPLPLTALALAVPWALPPEDRSAWLALLAFLAGGVALTALWGRQGLFTSLRAGPEGAHRYWLALALITTNTGLLALVLATLAHLLPEHDFTDIRAILGLALVYLAMTSVLRVYPRAVVLRPDAAPPRALTETEKALAVRIEALLDLDKVYQEPAYARADMARELEVSEAQLSRVVMTHFGVSLPKLLNARRVGDAQRLLRETSAPIQTIAGEVGFNSLASFNRVFREEAGTTPSDYRAGVR